MQQVSSKNMRILFQYFSGQGLVSFVNIAVGILFIRWLPIEDFAIYVLVMLLQTTACVFSDFGIASGVNTFISRDVENQAAHAGTLSVAWRLWKRFVPISIACVFVLAWFILNPVVQGWRFVIFIVFAIVCGVLQSQINIKKSVLNAHRDVKGLMRVGIAECIPRLLLSPLCFIFPNVELALAINLVGICAMLCISNRQALKHAYDVSRRGISDSNLGGFVIPLIPTVVYSLFQGHLGLLILGFYGNSHMVAEVGALGRLGQIVGLFLILNPFWIQPHFAKIRDRLKFRSDTFRLILILALFSTFLLLSVYLVPNAWLWVLGKNYQASAAQLPIAVGGGLFYYASSVLYTVALSREATRGQSWAIVVGVGLQVAFLSVYRVLSVSDALFLNMLPAIGSLMVQLVIIGTLMTKWPVEKKEVN